LLPLLLMTAEVPPLVAMRVAPKTVKPLLVSVSLVASTIRTLPDCWLESRTRFLMPLVIVTGVLGGAPPQPTIMTAANAIPSARMEGLRGITLAKTGFIVVKL